VGNKSFTRTDGRRSIQNPDGTWAGSTAGASQGTPPVSNTAAVIPLWGGSDDNAGAAPSGALDEPGYNDPNTEALDILEQAHTFEHVVDDDGVEGVRLMTAFGIRGPENNYETYYANGRIIRDCGSDGSTEYTDWELAEAVVTIHRSLD